MHRVAMIALALSLSAGVWAPSALGATNPQASGDQTFQRPDQGMQGDRQQGDQQYQGRRGRRGGQGQNGEQPQDRPRWGGQGQNGEQPQDRPNAEPEQQDSANGNGVVSAGQRTRGQGQRPHFSRNGRPSPDGSNNTEGSAQ